MMVASPPVLVAAVEVPEAYRSRAISAILLQGRHVCCESPRHFEESGVGRKWHLPTRAYIFTLEMPLLSRTLDPLLGVFTGLLAYYLYESNPRTAPTHKDSLSELLRWKRDKWRQEQVNQEAAAQADLVSASQSGS